MKDLPYLICVCCLTLVLCVDYSGFNYKFPFLESVPPNLVIILLKVVVLIVMIALILHRAHSRETEEVEA